MAVLDDLEWKGKEGKGRNWEGITADSIENPYFDPFRTLIIHDLKFYNNIKGSVYLPVERKCNKIVSQKNVL